MKLKSKIAELEREIETQENERDNGKNFGTAIANERILINLKAELKGLQEGAKQQKEDELEFLKELKLQDVGEESDLVNERIKHLEMKE